MPATSLFYRVTTEDARLIGFKDATAMRNALAKRKLPARKLGRTVVILKTDLDKHLQSLPTLDDVARQKRAAKRPKIAAKVKRAS